MILNNIKIIVNRINKDNQLIGAICGIKKYQIVW